MQKSNLEYNAITPKMQICFMQRGGQFMHVDEKELLRFQKAADINEIEMMFGRYVTLMDQMDAMSIYYELFAIDHPDVSIEYETCGTYCGPEHVKAFMEDFAAKLSDWHTKRGWLDFHDAGTPQVVLSKDHQRAQAMWTLFSPKAKPATSNASFSGQRTLTAFWQAGKMHWELIHTPEGWKILSLHQLTYFTTEYHTGWVKQQECYREPPFWAMKPDKKARFYVYHPDQVYVQNGQYDWGPYLPEDESF